MNDTFEVIAGDVLVRDRRIAAVGAVPPTEGVDRVIEAHGAFLLPGLIQTHIHLCQTLFRSYADDLALLDWSRTRLWPMEAAHTPTSLAAAACIDASFEYVACRGCKRQSKNNQTLVLNMKNGLRESCESHDTQMRGARIATFNQMPSYDKQS